MLELVFSNKISESTTGELEITYFLSIVEMCISIQICT